MLWNEQLHIPRELSTEEWHRASRDTEVYVSERYQFEEIGGKTAERILDPTPRPPPGSATTPTPTETPSPSQGQNPNSDKNSSSSENSKKLSGGAIAGIAVGALVVVAVIAGCAYFFFHQEDPKDDQPV